MSFSIGADLFPLAAAVLASLTCGLVGNFLVLRRMSLMGDAISHAVLPGLVIAFLIASSRSPLVMFAGAAIAGALTVVLVELVKKFGRVEPGAAMGVVFSILFALGVLLIEQAAARHVDLDADCVLQGQLEYLAWFGAPDSFAGLFSPDTLDAVPRQVWTLLGTAVAAILFVTFFFKELRITSFDAALATTQGFHAGWIHALLMLFVAGATVASFEAVGSILVIAMLICPGATARLMTDRLSAQIWWSAAVAIATALLGYLSATAIPALFDRPPLYAAGPIGVMSGVLLLVAIIASPSHGLVARTFRRGALARKVARDDLLAALFRAGETGNEPAMTVSELRPLFVGRPLGATIAASRKAGLVRTDGQRVTLTPAGEEDARNLVRRHRLWEHYLVDTAGLAPDHVHEAAEQLEHLGEGPDEGPETDPHGRTIP